jgi:hypothetical protein
MAWTAYFQNAVKRDGRWAFSIVFTDGTRKVAREYLADHLDDEAVKATARAEVANLAVVDAAVGKLTIADGQQIDLTAPAVTPPIPPTKDEQAAAAWFEDYGLAAKLGQAADSGLADLVAADLEAAQKRLHDGFKPEYLGLA